ncbi:MAG: IS66 family insertion sequence element accessory protein TnpB [Planctomycetota bacterium]|nr:IS66 family insertion sequence element accessory protein TnpB [Planctomycetota bacterium]
MTRQVFELDPVDGHLFLFFNRRRDRVKVLWWDRDGLALFCKRLEAGSYEVPACTEDRAGVEIDATQLSLLLNGIETTSVKRRSSRRWTFFWPKWAGVWARRRGRFNRRRTRYASTVINDDGE